MKIVYTICGDGNGHAFRSSVVIDHLLQQGHQVALFSSHKGFEVLQAKYPSVTEIHGWSLMYRGTRVKKSQTIARNMLQMRHWPKDLKRITSAVKAFKPEVVISDFDPAGALIATLYDLPLISIDNQHILISAKLKIPTKEYGEYFLARAYTEAVLPQRDHTLITSFFYPELKKQYQKNTEIFPSLIRPEVWSARTRIVTGSAIVVYQTTDSTEELLQIVRQSNEQFIIYKASSELAAEPNVIARTFSPQQMVEDLAAAKGVMANGGFTVLSESLYLGKPILSLPIHWQYEQKLNARQIEALGYGRSCDHLSLELFNDWLSNLQRYRERIADVKFDNSLLLSRLDEILAGKKS